MGEPRMVSGVEPEPNLQESECRDRFLERVRESDATGDVRRLTLSRLGGRQTAGEVLQKVMIRSVAIRGARHWSVTERYPTRDAVRNVAPEDGLKEVARWLGNPFDFAHLFLERETVNWSREGGQERMRTLPPDPAVLAQESGSGGHDRARKHWLDLKSNWMRRVGLTTAEGRVCRGAESKLRQVEHFVELLRPLLAEPLIREAEKEVRMVDLGAGKGYLTFATYEVLERLYPGRVRATGWERRADLAGATEKIARESGFHGLNFRQGSIEAAALDGVQIVLALHACDTATDDALAGAVRAGAGLILAAPCCHKELAPQLTPRDESGIGWVMSQGLMRQRQAEWVTDGLRAMLLEWAGYRVRMVEFIGVEETPKNAMIIAEKARGARPGWDRDRVAGEIRQLMEFWGVRRQRLAALLGFERKGGGRTGGEPA